MWQWDGIVLHFTHFIFHISNCFYLFCLKQNRCHVWKESQGPMLQLCSRLFACNRIVSDRRGKQRAGRYLKLEKEERSAGDANVENQIVSLPYDVSFCSFASFEPQRKAIQFGPNDAGPYMVISQGKDKQWNIPAAVERGDHNESANGKTKTSRTAKLIFLIPDLDVTPKIGLFSLRFLLLPALIQIWHMGSHFFFFLTTYSHSSQNNTKLKFNEDPHN